MMYHIPSNADMASLVLWCCHGTSLAMMTWHRLIMMSWSKGLFLMMWHLTWRWRRGNSMTWHVCWLVAWQSTWEPFVLCPLDYARAVQPGQTGSFWVNLSKPICFIEWFRSDLSWPDPDDVMWISHGVWAGFNHGGDSTMMHRASVPARAATRLTSLRLHTSVKK